MVPGIGEIGCECVCLSSTVLAKTGSTVLVFFVDQGRGCGAACHATIAHVGGGEGVRS